MADEIKEIDIQVSINEDINEASFILAPKSAQNMNEIYAAHLEEKIGGQIKAYKEDVECALDIVRNSEKEIEDFRTTIEESKIKCENAEEKSQNALTKVNNRANLNLSNLTEEGEAHFDNRYVNIAGDTMTGHLTLENGQIVIRSTNMDSADETAPSEQLTSRQIFFTDKNGNILGQMYTARTVANSQVFTMTVRRKLGGADKATSMSLFVDTNGIARFEFPRCTTKPTTASTASHNRTSLVSQNYLNGTSGYRVWTDGYCEQWGFMAGGTATVTLLKPYSDTTYAITLGLTDFNGSTYAPTIHSRTKSSFVIYTIAADRNCFWKTCGYIN